MVNLKLSEDLRKLQNIITTFFCLINSARIKFHYFEQMALPTVLCRSHHACCPGDAAAPEQHSATLYFVNNLWFVR